MIVGKLVQDLQVDSNSLDRFLIIEVVNVDGENFKTQKGYEMKKEIRFLLPI